MKQDEAKQGEINDSQAAVPASRMRMPRLFLAAVALIVSAAMPAVAASGQYVRGTPGYVATAQVLGAAEPSTTIEISLWLNLHNRGEFDALAGQLYDRTSPMYHQWLTSSEIAARYAPTAAEVQTVQQFLTAHNLKVVSVGPNNFFVRASGTVSDVQTAFQVQLNNYQVRDQVVRANSSDPYVEGDIAALVGAITGLDTGAYEHPLMTRAGVPSSSSSQGGVTAMAVDATSTSSGSSFFTSDCFDGVKTETYGTAGTFPYATYKGNHYFGTPTSPGCGYTPAELQTAYNLTALYKEGYTGTGQTIAILDWCGSPTIESDANAFSSQFGLPAINASNFKITTPLGASTCSGTSPEINLDVEWSHAVAPGAKINLVIAPTNSYQDTDETELYAVTNNLGTVISGSYGTPEYGTPASVLATENQISETAAVMGISTNFSSGDLGDYTYLGIPAAVSAPASSPYATSVGGVTLALNSNNTIAWQAGWGNYLSELTDAGTIIDPPQIDGFDGGSGGGASNCATQDASGNCLAGFPKPSFQNALPGNARQLPDISWVADPFTGVVVLITDPGVYPPQQELAYGGTSVAAPMFSGLWAIANQEAGEALGQAAPYLYSMPAGTIYDIVPFGSTHNVTASVKESATVTNTYTSDEIMGIPPGTYYTAMWDYPFFADTLYVLSFGTDSSLTTAPGWDNVTGVGTPNAKAFADFFKARKK